MLKYVKWLMLFVVLLYMLICLMLLVITDRLEQMEKAFNNSEILGDTFIDECDALRPYENQIVEVYLLQM